jgi:phosphomannomutase
MSYPNYFMSKNKIQLTPATDVDGLMKQIAEHYKKENVLTIDGVKIDFKNEWVHLRKSNTEPIIRVYTESTSQKRSDELAQQFIDELSSLAIA